MFFAPYMRNRLYIIDMSNGRKVNTIDELKVGDIVQHKARKTLKFKITRTIGRSSFSLQRCDMNGEVNTRYRGYRIGPSDVAKGYITLLKKADDAESKPAAEPTQKWTETSTRGTSITVGQLEKNDVLRQHTNIIAEFRRLEAQLSPENLTRDGEASPNQVAFIKKQIMDKWALLEAYVGQKVEPVV